MSLTARRRLFLVLILPVVFSGLTLVFKSYALIFWGLGLGAYIVAIVIPAKELYEKKRPLFWFIIPVILGAVSLGCIGSFLLLPFLEK